MIDQNCMFAKFLKGCGVAIGVVVLVVIALFVAMYVTAPSRFNVLIVGTDQRGEERSRSDVLMVLSVPKSPAKQTTLLTIPRDTYVNIPDYGLDKITHAYVYGEKKDETSLGNIDLTQQTVEEFLDMKMNIVFEFNFESFREIVNHVGGVVVDGKQLDGDAALAIVRDRYRAGGDFARTEDQRKVVQGVLDKIKSPGAIRDLLAYFQESENARLQYSTFDGVRFGGAYVLRRFGNISMPEIVEEVVPGTGSRKYAERFGQELYFWEVNQEEFEELKKRGLE